MFETVWLHLSYLPFLEDINPTQYCAVLRASRTDRLQTHSKKIIPNSIDAPVLNTLPTCPSCSAKSGLFSSIFAFLSAYHTGHTVDSLSWCRAFELNDLTHSVSEASISSFQLGSGCGQAGALSHTTGCNASSYGAGVRVQAWLSVTSLIELWLCPALPDEACSSV